MMNNIQKSLNRGIQAEAIIRHATPQKLEELKDQLMDDIGAPVGLHTAGLPLILSAILTLLCFTMPQVSLWHAIFSGLELPEHAIFIGIIPTIMAYCIFSMVVIMFIAKGYLLALKLYFSIIGITLLMAVCYLFATLVSWLSGNDNSAFIISAILGIIFIALSIGSLNTAMFVKTITFYLHNRVWRKLLTIANTDR